MADVYGLYESYVKQGMTPKEAAVKAQRETGLSAVTGKPFQQKKLQFTRKGVNYGGEFYGLFKRQGS